MSAEAISSAASAASAQAQGAESGGSVVSASVEISAQIATSSLPSGSEALVTSVQVLSAAISYEPGIDAGEMQSDHTYASSLEAADALPQIQTGFPEKGIQQLVEQIGQEDQISLVHVRNELSYMLQTDEERVAKEIPIESPEGSDEFSQDEGIQTVSEEETNGEVIQPFEESEEEKSKKEDEEEPSEEGEAQPESENEAEGEEDTQTADEGEDEQTKDKQKLPDEPQIVPSVDEEMIGQREAVLDSFVDEQVNEHPGEDISLSEVASAFAKQEGLESRILTEGPLGETLLEQPIAVNDGTLELIQNQIASEGKASTPNEAGETIRRAVFDHAALTWGSSPASDEQIEEVFTAPLRRGRPAA